MGSVEPVQVEGHHSQLQSIEANEVGEVPCEVVVCKTMIWSELRLK